VGTLLDSSILIRIERTAAALDVAPDDEVGIAAITASELLHGVHRADAAHRTQREAFVENVLRVLPVYPFSFHTARIHARLWADLVGTGQMIGAHDLMLAATALSLGWSVATLNVQEFRRVPGLSIRGLTDQAANTDQ
jgi:tRNA(fMet)-specific endonuclease VapC